MMHEPPAATANTAALPGVLATSFDRLPATSSGQAGEASLATYWTSTPQVRVPRCRGMVAGWHDHLQDLATASRA